VRVIVDQEQCCGAGQCVLEAADVFVQRDDDGIAEVIMSDPPAERHEAIRRAVELCPASAIRVETS
jgi:ferredoxin